MSGRWPPENNAKHTSSSLRDMNRGAVEDTALFVREEDVAELCKREIWSVKNMIRPDTSRIAVAFDKMMDAVKRRSSQRHQDVNTAIERCFTAFSGRGKNSLSIYQFARRLSVLSMEWSGNFSNEEYLALAQDVSEEDTPGVVTLESFMCAARTGAVNLPPCWRKNVDGRGNRSATARDALQEGNAGCRVDGFDDEVGVRRGPGAPTARDTGGRVLSTEGTLETILRQAAARARTNGQDVWKLLDASILAALGEARVDEDNQSPTSDDVVAQTSLGPEVVRRFLSKLDVRVVPSPPPSFPSPRRQPDDMMGEPQSQRPQQQQQLDEQAADSRSPRREAHGQGPSAEQREGAGETAAASSFLSVRNAFEERSRGSREGNPAGKAPAAPSSLSPQFSSARSAFESKKTSMPDRLSAKSEAPTPSLVPSQEAPSACDRYLRTLSRETASVRCRVQFYNQELARTLQEAESLVSRAAAMNINGSESFQQSSRLLQPESDGSAAARRGLGGSGGGDSSVVAEVGGGMAAATGGGGGGAAGMSSNGPIIAFSRVSPVGRADPSHPRMDIVASRPGNTLQAPSPPSHGGRAPDPGQGSGSAPPREGGSGRGALTASAGASRRSSGGEEPKVAVSDRVAKLLLAALGETKANAPSSSAASPAAAAAVDRRKIGAAPKTACFDPPSVRNGLTGLTPDDVDNLLLRVEAATPGAVSSWKSPVSSGRRRPRTGGTEVLTPSTLGRGLAPEARDRRRRSMNLSADSIGWFGFDLEGSAKEILQDVGAQGAAGDGSGARRNKGGGGARRKRSMLNIRLPPRTLTTPSKRTGAGGGTIQAAPASTRRTGSWRTEHVEWASSVDDDEDADAAGDFTGNNPMYGRPVETVDDKNIQSRTLPAPPKRTFSFASRKKGSGGGGGGGGPPSSSDASWLKRSNQTAGPPSGNSADEAYPYDSSASTFARYTRRPVRAFQKLDEDVYDEFLNCTKKKTKAGRGIRRMGTLG